MPLIWLLIAAANGVVLKAMGFSSLMIFVLGGAAFCFEVLGVGLLYRNEIPAIDGGKDCTGVEGFLEDTAKQMEAAGAQAAMIEIANLTENAPLVLGLAEGFAESHRLCFCALPRGLRDGELWLTRNESLKEALYSEYRNSNMYAGFRDPKLRSLAIEQTRESLLRGLIVRRKLALRPRL